LAFSLVRSLGFGKHFSRAFTVTGLGLHSSNSIGKGKLELNVLYSICSCARLIHHDEDPSYSCRIQISWRL
jgi:hypothetical protein